MNDTIAHMKALSQEKKTLVNIIQDAMKKLGWNAAVFGGLLCVIIFSSMHFYA